MKLEKFADVEASMRKNGNRKFHLLLGNGFSVAFDPGIFSYNALHDFISSSNDPDLQKILKSFESKNFEAIMRYLDSFIGAIEALGGNKTLSKRLDAVKKRLKLGLLEGVRALHPEHVFKISESKSAACVAFLSRFLTTGGSIYSTNYDLLLYWVLMRNSVEGHVDGCGRELLNDTGEVMRSEDQEWSELLWGKHRRKQNIFYLHGALPFFDTGTAVTKEEYDSQNFLLEKISSRMDNGEYPIFVTAGDARQKLENITHNQYLTFCYDNFCEVRGSLVVLGFSFGESDRHIIDAINRAARQPKNDRLWSIYVAVFSDQDRKHMEKISSQFKCKVHLFDALSAQVWGCG